MRRWSTWLCWGNCAVLGLGCGVSFYRWGPDLWEQVGIVLVMAVIGMVLAELIYDEIPGDPE